jgi:aryl-alcohol dehydrogenase-like predicted oxidoreductase
VKYTSFGATGVQVGRLALGTLMMGSWSSSDQDEHLRIVDPVLDAGINIVGSSDVCSASGSEEIVGWIMRARENSLHCLHADWIDLYQVRRYTPETRLDETLAALTWFARARCVTSGRGRSPHAPSSRRGDADHGVSFTVQRRWRSSLGLSKRYDESMDRLDELAAPGTMPISCPKGL